MPSADRGGRVLAGVDRASFVTALGHRLRDAGVPVTLTGFGALTEALAASAPRDLAELYWTARVTLVHRPRDLATFDVVFDAVFRESVVPVGPQARRRQREAEPGREEERAVLSGGVPGQQAWAALPWHTLPRSMESADDRASGRALPELMPSAVEHLADVPFEELDEAQLEMLGTWLERTLQRWPTRRSGRRRVHHGGDHVALRETIARSRHTGWEAFELSRSRQVLRPRAVTLLADVSQSMQSYAAAYLHLMRAFARAGRAETFVFSTSLTRLTPALAHKSSEVAIAEATAQTTDRYSGTQLARSLQALLHSRQGNAIRGGVLVVASDGWDSDEPAALDAAMARARRRAHRIVWLNPRAAAPGFAPLVGSMAAALPYCDAFLPANTLRSMPAALDAIVGGRGPSLRYR